MNAEFTYDSFNGVNAHDDAHGSVKIWYAQSMPEHKVQYNSRYGKSLLETMSTNDSKMP